MNKEIENIGSLGALCALKTIYINGEMLDEYDFGEKYDTEPENAEDYGCGNMQFIPFEEVREETLKKYKINEEEYRAIQKKLDCLSFGCCGWCV